MAESFTKVHALSFFEFTHCPMAFPLSHAAFLVCSIIRCGLVVGEPGFFEGNASTMSNRTESIFDSMAIPASAATTSAFVLSSTSALNATATTRCTFSDTGLQVSYFLPPSDLNGTYNASTIGSTLVSNGFTLSVRVLSKSSRSWHRE